MNKIAKKLLATPLYEGHGEESDLPEEAAEEIARLESLVEELKADRIRINEEAEAEIKRLREALDRTAEQALSSEIAECGDDYWEAILEDSDERASYQRGYDAAIMCARKALEGGE